MGVVVGEPQLKRNRKDPKNPKASYCIYWTDSIEGSKEKSTGKSKYSEALQYFNRWRLTNIGVIDSRPISEVLIDEVLDYYKDAQIARDKDIERLESSLKRLRPFLGKKPVSAIGSLLLKEYEVYRFELHDKLYPNSETISINTIRRELTDLQSALNKADDDRYIDRRVKVTRPQEIKKGVEYFTCQEAIAILRASMRVKRAYSHLRLFLQIGFLTGRRKAAILELRWNDVKLKENFIKWMPDGKVETNKKRPIGRISPRLKKILIRHRELNPKDEFVICYQSKPILDIKRSFNEAVKFARISLAKQNGTKECDELQVAYPHMMRHSAATWRMQLGLDVEDVAEYLGMTAETLRRRYWHHHPDFQKDAADAY